MASVLGDSECDIDGGIKTRLRNNSGANTVMKDQGAKETIRTPKKTPKKVRRDHTPSTNPKRMQEVYQAEGRSMQEFLNKQTVGDLSVDDSDTEIEISLGKQKCNGMPTIASVSAEAGDKATMGGVGCVDNSQKGENA